jgi:hypothetical protein
MKKAVTLVLILAVTVSALFAGPVSFVGSVDTPSPPPNFF